MAAVIARIGMLAAALAAIAVSAVWLHDAHSFSSAQNAALAAKTPAGFEHAAALFRKGRALSPDAPAQAGEALALLRAGQKAPAAAVLEDALRQEPRNVRLWVGLYLADPARAGAARAKIRELAPPVGH
jgi:hypothetical protein